MIMEPEEDEIEQRFRDLCLAVNMDKPTMEIAWGAYEKAKTNYTLEGDSLHWLVCALYAACRRNLPSMVSVSGKSLASNCISLTMLLREAHFRYIVKGLLIRKFANTQSVLKIACPEALAPTLNGFISFLKKMEKWLDMNRSSLLEPLSQHVTGLDRSFRVSTVVFKKYQLVFQHVFKNPDDPNQQSVMTSNSRNPSRPHRSRRVLKRQCTSREIFNFCWTLFIHAKGTAYRDVSDELISSFQLLLSAIDLCFKNALACDHRKTLLNQSFSGLPEDWEEHGLTSCISNSDIIALLVKQHAALQLTKEETDKFLLEARVRNFHNWKKFVSDLLDPSADVFVGDEQTLFLPDNFHTNSKAINKVYEEYVLTEGDFDERVFLCDDVDRELGTPIKCPPSESRSEQINKEVAEHLAVDTTVAPKTPLTNRQYLRGKQNDGVPETPVSAAYVAAAQLRKILHDKKPEPSRKLLSIFSECQESPEAEILTRISKLSETFKTAYTEPYGELPPSTPDIAECRLLMSKTLYFHVLERTMLQEKIRLKNSNADLSGLLKRDDFHKLLFACCVEIVLCSYSTNRNFPWVLDAFGMASYYFYKVIELVVRAEERLSSLCVKHLNHIEEQVLESLAWKSDSPLWDALEDVTAPTCVEVNHHQHMESGVDKSSLPVKSPLTHPRLKAVVDSDLGTRKTDAGSAQDRFSSPAPGSAKRRLFMAPNPELPEDFSKSTEDANVAKVQESPLSCRGKPKRVGSLALFYRKVYHLASVRLRHLCEQLAISAELRTKIWTCFEHSVSVLAHDLIRDRHIDQLLMCSVYIMAKITQHDQSFQEIMRCYRNQPQASSSVYRSVLIARSASPVPVPSKPTLRSSGTIKAPDPPPQARIPEVREDLILFYNKIYVPNMKKFVKKFNPDSTQALEVPLSPMPRHRPTAQSPRRVSANSNIYVSPLKSRAQLGVSPSRIEYNFSRSPAKNLHEINDMMQRHTPVISMKRHLAFVDEDEVGAKRPAISRRLKMVHAERNGTST